MKKSAPKRHGSASVHKTKSRAPKVRHSKLETGRPRPVPKDGVRSRRLHTWPADLEPCWIASSVCGEVSGFLHVRIPKRYEVWLTRKAEVCFQKNERFRKGICGRGSSGRDLLYMNMRHWLSSMLKCERLDLWHCLPDSYDMGHPLPRGDHPRRNRRNSLDLPPWRNWQPERVLTNNRWQFLAAA